MTFTFVILTYGRPIITGTSINSLFSNTKITPSESWIIDDGSSLQMQTALFNFQGQYSRQDSPINIILCGKNYGVGFSFERAYNIMRAAETDVVCFIESDYVWRKNWLEDVEAVFEASPYTIAIAGCNHPDMYDRNKTHNEFCKLMVDQFGRDLSSRKDLYAPFTLETKQGPIKVQGVSNSCGCQIVHWKRLKEILKSGDNTTEIYSTKCYWEHMDRAFHKNGTGSRQFASDAHMSGTLSFFAEKWMEDNSIDITKNFGFLDICDYSISQHVAGGGINGKICPEGTTFITTPAWDNKYLTENPRVKK